MGTKTAATTRKPIPTSQMHVERCFQRSYNYCFQKLFLSECSTFHKEVSENCQKGSFPRVGSLSILRILQLEERTCNLVNHNNALYIFKFPSPMLIAT